MAKRINTDIIDNYEKLQKQIPDIIKAYNYNLSGILREIGMSKSTFYNKVENRRFKPSELRQITDYINK